MIDESPFEIRSSTVEDVLVLDVAGVVDMSTSPELASALELVTAMSRGVVVDLTDVSFLDSSGLNALLQGRRALDALGIPLRVVTAAEGAVRRVFEITQLLEPLDVRSSLAEALA